MANERTDFSDSQRELKQRLQTPTGERSLLADSSYTQIYPWFSGANTIPLSPQQQVREVWRRLFGAAQDNRTQTHLLLPPFLLNRDSALLNCFGSRVEFLCDDRCHASAFTVVFPASQTKWEHTPELICYSKNNTMTRSPNYSIQNPHTTSLKWKWLNSFNTKSSDPD